MSQIKHKAEQRRVYSMSVGVRSGTLRAQKVAALRASASAAPHAGYVDARASTGFMPLGLVGRVLRWPDL